MSRDAIFDMKLQWDPREGADTVENRPEFDFSALLADLRSELQNCKEHEEKITFEAKQDLQHLQEIYGSADEFAHSFDQAVARLNNQLAPLECDVRKLASSLSAVHRLAENISSRVIALDTAKGRVIECLQLVGDLRDLRVCAEGVELAMKQEIFDTAAHHIHRFLTLDSAVFKIGNQMDIKDPEQSMQKSYEILRRAAGKLKEVIECKFDEAQKAQDIASMERFFKLFPLINEHASGLQRFGRHLCSKIEKLGDDNFKIMQAGGTDDKRKNVLYADSLTLLLEGIARIIEVHQPLVDGFYGPDKFLDLIEIVQKECDKQSIRIINSFVMNRKFDHWVKKVEECVDSRDYLSESSVPETGRVNALDLDILLAEVTVLHTRAELYFRFLQRRLGEAPARPLSETKDAMTPSMSQSMKLHRSSSEEPTIAEMDVFEEETYKTSQQRKEALEKVQQQKKEREKKLDKLLHRSSTSLRMQELLGKYVLMEQYYMSESARKAIEMDSVEEGALTSSLLDDIFFIVRKSIRRSIGSSSIDCVCALLNNAITLFDMEFIRHISSPIKLGYPGVGLAAEITHTAQTAINPWMEGGGLEKQKSAFLVALNNLQGAIGCITELKHGLNDDFLRYFRMTETEKGKLENSMGQFDDMLSRKLEHYVNLSISKLVDAAFKPKIKSSAETYMDIPHSLTDDELAEYEDSNPFVENYISTIDRLLGQFENLLLPEVYHALVQGVCVEAVHQFERITFKCTFNSFGAMQLERDFRQLIAYLTSLAGWIIREKSARISQNVNLLNSASIEEAINNAQGIQSTPSTGLLTSNEIRKILLLRNDFPKEKVKAAKLR